MDNNKTSFSRVRSLLPRQRAALAIAALALTVGTMAGAGADSAVGGSGVTTTTKKATTSSSSPSTTKATTTTTSQSTSTTKATTTSSSSTTIVNTTTTLGTPGCADIQAARAAFNADIDAQVAAINASALPAGTKAVLIAQLESARAQGNAAFDEALAGCGGTS